MMQQGGGVPLREVSTLTATNGAYLLTGMNSDYNLKIEIYNVYISGNYALGALLLSPLVRYHKSSHGMWIGANGQRNISYIFNNSVREYFAISPYESYYQIDNNVTQLTWNNFDCETEFGLFVRVYNNGQGSISYNDTGVGKMGRCRMERLGVIRDYVPAVCTSPIVNVRGVLVPAGTAGMWNKTDDTFWTSDGSVEFGYIE